MPHEPDFSSFRHVRLVAGDSSPSVIYSPGGSADRHLAPAFAEHGLEGSGYDWQSLVHAALLHDPILQDFRFDSEAGMFCAYGSNLGALFQVATTVEKLLGDAESVRGLLVIAAENDLLD